MNYGNVKAIIGPVSSGKTSQLISDVRRNRVAGFNTVLFTPTLDNRYGSNVVATHNKDEEEAIDLSHSSQIPLYISGYQTVLGFDEVQFLDSGIITFCNNYANHGGIVIVSGLLKDFRDEPFQFSDGKATMLDFLIIADEIRYQKAICTHPVNGKICGRNATRSQRFIDGVVAPYDGQLVELGTQDAYKPRCREHFQFYQKPKKS